MNLRAASLAVLAALIAAPALAGAGLTVETFTERSWAVADPAATAQQRLQLHSTLTARQVPAALDRPLLVEVPPLERAALARRPAGERRIRVGLVRPLPAAFAFPGTGGPGALRIEPESFVWTAAVRSPGASALRLHLAAFSLAPGVELYLYTRQGEVFGPYTGSGPGDRGEFWSHTVMGEEALLQLHYRGPEPTAALAGTTLELTDLGWLGERFVFAVLGRQARESLLGFCSFNEACVENVSCHLPLPAGVADAMDAVAYYEFISGAWIYLCSGGLLADTDTGSQIPYFITANHCLSRAKQAAAVEAFFQFITPCGGECYDPSGVVPRTLGATVVATGKTGDFTLLELAEPAPAGSAFLGWTSAEVAFTDGLDLYRISHPGGAPQAYSEHLVDTSKGVCSSWPRGDWIYSHDLLGATEGGSSGSPVMNASGQVVGQLSGGCGTNVNDVCDFESNATVDGAFATYFPLVAPWLDPGGGCTPTEPTEATCDDGVDNDCDTFTDCDDSDCAGDPACPQVQCSDFTDKSTCNAQPGCTWNNRFKVCMDA